MPYCNEYAILEISDGTTTVNLLDPLSGFFVTDWKPSIPGPKNDGVWQSGPFTDGRRLAVRTFDNAIENMTLQVRNWNPDALIRNMQELRRLLEKAITYWTTSWQTGPVWIHAKSIYETNERWAIIYDYRTPNDGYPYGDVWTGISNAAIDDFALVLERGHWQDVEPGDSNCVWISAEQAYTATSTTNLVLNPGFETAGGGGADIWANWTENAGTGALADVGGADVHSGAHACRATAGAAMDTYVAQSFTVTPLTRYTWSFWTKGDGVNAGRYWLWDTTHGMVIFNLVSTGVTAAIYSQVTINFQVPSGCTSIISRLYCPPVNGGICYYDDVALYRYFDKTLGMPGECVASTEVLANRGFEEAGTGGADLWLRWAESVGAGAIADSTPHTGAHAARLTAGAPANTYIGQIFTSVPGKVYTWSFWTRTDAGDNPGRYLVWDQTHGANIIVLTSTGISGVVYMQKTVTFTVPAGCVQVFLALYCSATNTDVVYYDDNSCTYVPTCTCDTDSFAYVANKHNKAQITDIYWNDVSLGTWSDNLAEATPAFALFPDTIQNNDVLYFGCDTALPNSGPFCSLVFDILTPAVYAGGASTVWQYWDGGGWITFNVTDNTDGGVAQNTFAAAGINSVHWVQPSTWTARAVNGVTGYWIRVLAVVPAGSISTPIQQNRGVYTIVTPYAEFDADQAGGDIPALLKLWLYNQSHDSLVALYADEVIIATRSISRGTSFTPYINLGNVQNVSGISVFALNDGSFVADPISPSGMKLSVTNPAGELNDCQVQIAHPLCEEYTGTFRFLARGRQTSGAAGALHFRANITMGGTDVPFFESKTIYPEYTNEWQIFDFGPVTIPPDAYVLWIVLYVAGNGVADLDLFDFILMPADEFRYDNVCHVNASGNKVSEYYGCHLSLDSLGDHRKLRARLMLDDAHQYSPYIAISPSNFAGVQANANQRIWFFATRLPSTASTERRSNPEFAGTTKIAIASRYLSMRGDR